MGGSVFYSWKCGSERVTRGYKTGRVTCLECVVSVLPIQLKLRSVLVVAWLVLPVVLAEVHNLEPGPIPEEL